MTDPTALAAASAPPAEIEGAAARAAAPARFDAADTRTFAAMMRGGPAAPGGAARSLAAQFSGNVRSYDELRHSMLAAIDLSDPIKTMFVMTDHAMEAHMLFARLHISTGLASAATSLFGTLLKNQQ
jgi:hypothetical protein